MRRRILGLTVALLAGAMAVAADSPLDFYLPMVTPSMSPGEVVARRVPTGINQALFIVGADARSRAWLRTRRAELTGLQALGFVVNVATRSELDALRALVPELELQPIPGEALALHFDLQHYPVLITAAGIGP